MSWLARLQGVCKRVVVDLAGDTYQLLHSGDQVLPDTEYFEPQGLHFRAPTQAQGVALSPGALTSSAVVVNLSGPTPTDAIDAHEGGLHYAGMWRVFLDGDGTVHLGERDASDWVALASRVDAELTAIKADLDKIKIAHDGHIHITTATIGSGAAVGVLSPPAITVPTPHSPETVASKTVRTK